MADMQRTMELHAGVQGPRAAFAGSSPLQGLAPASPAAGGVPKRHYELLAVSSVRLACAELKLAAASRWQSVL